MSQLTWLLNFIENVHFGEKDPFGTKLKKNPRQNIFLKNVVPKESFFFVKSDIPCRFTRD